MVSKLEEKRAARFRFLETLYEMVDGSQAVSVDFYEVGKKAGLDPGTTINVFQYLSKEGLIKGHTLQEIVLTHRGVKEYEAALSSPAEPTEYFPPVNVVNNIMNVTGGITGSQIQQSTKNSTQVINNIDSTESEDIKEFIQLVKEKLPELELDQQSKKDVEAEIHTIEAQLKSSKPKKTIINTCLQALRDILVGVASSAASRLLLEGISSFI